MNKIEIITEYYGPPNKGKKSREFEVVNGVQNGIHKAWYYNGQQKYLWHNVNGIGYGLTRGWLQSGELDYDGYVINGILEGELIG